MKRRDFMRLASSGAIIATSAGTVPSVQARENLEVPDNAVGLLFDATRCIGCRACVVSCREINGTEPVTGENGVWDSAQELSADTYNIIKAYNPTEADKAAGIHDFSFSKRNCMHCVDPGCVSVCPVTAMTKHPVTGIVSHDPDVCIGCRYCVAACPYNVPKYDYDNPVGQIHKCQLCNQKGVERIDKGLLPGCAEVCPTGANIFGTRKELLAEAKRRLAQAPGTVYEYPLNVANSTFSSPGTVPEYQPHIYGEHEGGGTQVLVISSVPHEKLGLPDLPDRSYASVSENVQHTIYAGMAAPAAILAGLMFLARRGTKNHTPDDQD